MNSYLSNLLYELISIGIPECTAITVLALTILKQKYSLGKILLISLPLVFTIFICRGMIQINGIPGIHTAVATIAMALLISFFYQVPKHHSLTVSIVCMVIITFCEFISCIFLNKIFYLDISELVNNRLLWIIVNWLHIITVVIAAFVLYKTNWYQRPVIIDKAR